MRRPHRASSGKRNRIRLLKKGPGRPIPRRGRPKAVALPAAAAAAKDAGAGADAARSLGHGGAAAIRAETSAAAEAASNPISENGVAAESTRCGFGAVRAGPLLGRLRLHLQTERFLAVHRGDALWEECCVAGTLALNEIIGGMSQGEFNASLAPPRTERKISIEPGQRMHSLRCVRTRGLEAIDGISKTPPHERSRALSQFRADSLAPLEDERAPRAAKESLDYLASARAQELTPDFVLAREQSTRWGEAWGTRKTGTAALAACGAALEPRHAEVTPTSGAAIAPTISPGVITSPPRAKTSVFTAEKRADEGSAVGTKQVRGRTADRACAQQHEPGSPAHAVVAGAGVEEPGSPTRPARARSAKWEESPRVGVEERGAR